MTSLNRHGRRVHTWFSLAGVNNKPAPGQHKINPPRAQLPWTSVEVGVPGSEDESCQSGLDYKRLLLSTSQLFFQKGHAPSSHMLQPPPLPLQKLPPDSLTKFP